MRSDIKIKVDLLCNGLTYDQEFLDQFSMREGLQAKRWAYSNSESEYAFRNLKIPPEIIFKSGIISSVNYEKTSPYSLKYINGKSVLVYEGELIDIDFPVQPKSYGQKLSNNISFESVCTFYGDTTLGIFTPGHCFYFNNNQQCKFCSLGAARKNLSDHEYLISPGLAAEATQVAIDVDTNRIERILLNGGNLIDYDRGFNRHMEIIKALSRVEGVNSLDMHLITMPPKNFDLFKNLQGKKLTLAMSLEIYNEHLFDKICPGKSNDYGRDKMIESYKVAVNVLGAGNVYVGFIAGLEPLESLIEGMDFFADMGVVPAVAVFHRDAGSELNEYPRPSSEMIWLVGKHMSELYKKHSFSPFIPNSGRNSLDTEAYLQGFIENVD